MTQAWWRVDGDDLIVAMRLTPRSAREAIGKGVWHDEQGAAWLQAQVRAVPEKGRANAALVTLMARTLKVPASAVSVISGDTARLKRVRIAGRACDADVLAERLGIE